MKIREIHNRFILTVCSAVRGLLRKTYKMLKGKLRFLYKKTEANQRIFVTSSWRALHYITCASQKVTRANSVAVGNSGTWFYTRFLSPSKSFGKQDPVKSKPNENVKLVVNEALTMIIEGVLTFIAIVLIFLVFLFFLKE